MSASEPDISESSNLESPSPQSDSPYSSPSQQVPQLANFLTVLSCGDNTFNYDTGKYNTKTDYSTKALYCCTNKKYMFLCFFTILPAVSSHRYSTYFVGMILL